MIRVNLLGEARAKRKRVRAPVIEPGSGMVMGLLVGVLLVVAVTQYMRYGSLRDDGERLDQEITELQRERAELAQVQAQYELFSRRKELLTAHINIIEQLKSQQSGPVLLLDTLASAVSNTDSLWLTEFNKTGQSVSVSGTSLTVRAVADLMTRLIASNTFADVTLQEAVQDATVDYESFSFTLVVELQPVPTASEAEATAVETAA